MSHSDDGHTGEQPDSNLPDPSSQVTAPIYAEITDEESKDPSVGANTPTTSPLIPVMILWYYKT